MTSFLKELPKFSKSMDSREKAILKTLLYSNLFDYPLTKEEIYRYLIGLKTTEKDLYSVFKSPELPVQSKAGFFFLSGKTNLINKRKRREKISSGKLKKAEKIIRKIAVIPTIKLVGISGALAMKNSEKEDDIDIFIISEKNLVWLTRLFVVLQLILLGVYRTKNSRNNQDKICLNFLLGEERIGLDEKNLFTAHEVAQLIPVFDRGNTYQRFLAANNWIKEYLPNISLAKKVKFKKETSIFDKTFVSICKALYFEKIAKALQIIYMQRGITKEKLEDGLIGLHPFDYKIYALRRFKRYLRKFEIA